MTLKRRMLIGVASFHFLVIILHNISSTADGYQRIYVNHGLNEPKSSALALIQKANQLTPIAEYARFSGAGTGFGFFAPQVGSQYISRFKAFDANEILLSESIAPGIKQQEGLLRYSSFLDHFQDMLHAERTKNQNTKESEHFDVRYSRAIVYSMAERMLANTQGATKVEAEIYLYNYPTLKAYKTGSQPRYIPIYQQNVDRKPFL